MRYSCLLSPLRTLVFTALLYLFAPAPAHAQSPYIYASLPGDGTTSQIAGFSVGLDGALTPISGSPFNLSREGGLVTTDPGDQFLVVLNPNSNTISVLSINLNTGALTEVSGSPVPAPTPQPGGGSALSGALGMATFKGTSASYLYVAYRTGPMPFTGAIAAFQIGTETQPLTPITTTTLEATPVDMTISPQGNLYVALQLVPGSKLGNQTPGLALFPIDPNSGQLGQSILVNSNLHEDSLALNPTATVLFDGEGSSAAGFIESAQIRSDGTTLAPQSLPVVSPNSPPSAMLVDGSGQLLYVQQGGQAAVYTIDHTTGVLSPPSTSPAAVPFSIVRGTTVADPVEPYLYTLQSGELHVFVIKDHTTGAVIEANGSPYLIPLGSGGLAITHDAATQTALPHAAQLLPFTINFIDTNIGQTNSATPAVLTNTGTQPLDIFSISINGADASDFSLTACPPQLAPGTPCSITVSFIPNQSGALQATLIVTDDANPSTQSIQLTGNGVAASSSGPGSGSGGTGGNGGSGSGGSGGSGGTGGSGGGSGGSGNPPSSSQPTISVSSLALSFMSSALNTAAPPQNITLTNNSPASLQISSLQIIGSNASDFALDSDNCTNQSYAINRGCTPSVIFTPSASGSRSATLVVTDNAVNSPQLISLSGVTQAEILTISPRPESNGSGYSQTVSAGETANFPLLLSTTFNGTVFFSPCSGAPATATCTPPTPMTVVANQPMTFSVSVTTIAASPSLTLLDELTHYRRRTGPSQITPSSIPQIIFTTACAFILFRRRRLSLRPIAISASATITLAAFLALTIFTIAGCGGASTVATATTVTPTSASQTYTIIITPTAVTSDKSSVPNVQPLQLTLVVN